MSKWNIDSLKIASAKYDRRIDFKKHCSGGYRAAIKLRVMDEVCMHMQASRTKNQWTNDKIFKEALKYKTKAEFEKNNKAAYAAAKHRNIYDEACIHMVPAREEENWTTKKIHKISLRYDTRNDFKKNEPNAYAAARRKKVVNKVCSHMIQKWENWTFEKIQDEALKYKHRSDFEKSSRAYDAARKRKIINIVCSHMTRKTDSKVSSDNNIIYLWNIKDTNVYKIGVTSKKRGYARINEVSRKHNIKAVVLAYVKVDDAFSIESELHNAFNCGQDIVTKGDGVTEFKTLKYHEVVEALDYIKQYMIEGKLTYPKYING